MSAKESGDVLMRQWHLLKKIPSHGCGATVAELHASLARDGFATTTRTVQRNLVTLSTMFAITSDDDRTAPRWFWMKDASLDIPNLSIQDALSIKMMQDYLTPLLPNAILRALNTRFEQAGTRLEHLDNTLTRWPEKIRTVIPGQPLKAPVIADGVLSSIQTALLEERQVKADYRRRNSHDSTEFVLHPLALVQRGPVSYLVATAFTYDDVRLYALHRFASIELLDEKATIPASFDIDTYISKGALGFGSGELFVLTLRVQPDLRTTLAESPLSDDMQITEDGDAFLVTATVQNTWQLKWWLQSQCDQAEVLSPPSLRQDIKAALKLALARYQDE